ncbi:alpha/beta hydrolase [Xanthomonas hyacinthi]|nr:alpha/beta hydrolase fold domain-containing protein [Xanthomonas hyacinthi]
MRSGWGWGASRPAPSWRWPPRCACATRTRYAARARLLNDGAFDPHIAAHTAAAPGGADAMLSAAEMDEFWSCDLGAAAQARRDPLHAALHGLPPALLLWGERDLLGAQNAQMAQRLAGSGGGVQTRVYPGAPHGLLEAMPVSVQARDALAAGADWLRRHLQADARAADSRENEA